MENRRRYGFKKGYIGLRAFGGLAFMGTTAEEQPPASLGAIETARRDT